jgi:serine protease
VEDGEEQLKQQIAEQPGVTAVQPNIRYRTQAFPNDTYFGLQWNFSQVNVPQAWDLEVPSGTRGGLPSVTVAVVDSGAAFESFTDPNPAKCFNGGVPIPNCVAAGAVYAQAPDLSGTRFAPGYDFVNLDTHPNDDNGHGSHVTGTIAATTDNAHGEAGIAFSTTILPIKALDRNGEGTTATITAGVDFAVANGAAVINLSLGATVDDPVLHSAITAATSSGVTVVAASGNSNAATLAFPAAYPEVVAVGAVRYDRTRAFYSNYGTNLDFVAPGGDFGVDQNGDGNVDGILQETFSSLDSGGLPLNYTTFGQLFIEGTSAAAPHVAAAVALLRSAGVTGDAAVSALTATSTDLGPSGYDTQYGNGLINIQFALASILAPAGAPSGSITINGGDVATPTPAVALTLSAIGNGSDVTDMAFSHDGSTFTAYEPYAGSRSWDLFNPVGNPAGDGVKTVWVKFRNAALAESSPVTDTIVFDTVRPTPPSVLSLFTDSSKAHPLPFRRVGSSRHPYATWKPGSDAASGILGTIVSVTLKPTAAVGSMAGDSSGVLSMNQTGKFYVNLAAVDYAGHRSTTASFAITRAPARLVAVLNTESSHRLRVLDSNLVVRRRVALPEPAGAPLSPVDLNGTGEEQLAVGDPGRDRISVRRTDGTPVRTYDGITGVPGVASLAAADVNRDGRDELIIGSTDGRVVVMKATGTVLKTFRPFGTERVPLIVATGELVSNVQPEIVVNRASGASDVRVYTPGGRRLSRFVPGSTSYRGGWNLAVLDLDNNGVNEIALAPRGRADPVVRLYSVSGKLLNRIKYARDQFGGGLVIAGSDLDGDAAEDLVIGPRIGRGPVELLHSDSLVSLVTAFGSSTISNVSLTVVHTFR